jgi:hypothetical protein
MLLPVSTLLQNDSAAAEETKTSETRQSRARYRDGIIEYPPVCSEVNGFTYINSEDARG